MDHLSYKYLIASPADRLWGTTVNSVGCQIIRAGDSYPQGIHPTRYLFSQQKGRILDDFQMVYITEGSGRFRSGSQPQYQPIGVGSLFLLFPGEWHSYRPEEATGWKEYWIGFNGVHMGTLLKNDFFSPSKPVWDIGLHYDIVELYEEAIEVARLQEAGFQQRLSGIVQHILGLVWFYSRNVDKSEIANQINKAKILIGERVVSISPEDVARALCMSYSHFRRVFKSYTGLSPARYIQQMRMYRVKESLTNTNKPIKQIAFEAGFENKDYFFTAFRRHTGMTPKEYRTFTRGGEK